MSDSGKALEGNAGKSRGAAALGILAAVWIAMIVVARPAGEFPLNDSWSYAQPARLLVEEGRLRLGDWTEMPLAAQVLWGALFCLPYGFSYTALRVGSWTAGLLGVFLVYGLMREAGAGRKGALAGALAAAVCPVYFGLSHSFMTDVHFFMFSVGAYWFFVRALKRDSAPQWIAGAALACAATLIRQPGAAIALSAGVACLAKRGIKPRAVAMAALPLAVCLLALCVFETWLNHVGKPTMYGSEIHDIVGRLRTDFGATGKGAIKGLAYFTVYAGAFLFPALALILPGFAAKIRGRHASVVVVLAIVGAHLVFVPLLAGRMIVPRLGNVLCDSGIGPATLHDAVGNSYAYWPPSWPAMPKGVWFAATGLGIMGAVLLLREAIIALLGFRRRKENSGEERNWLSAMAFSGLILNAIPSAMATPVFDRYLLPILPLLFILIAPALKGGKGTFWDKAAIAFAAALILLSAAFSTAGVHDRFAWNRARWAALDALTEEQGIPPRRIDGGYEFCALHLYTPGYVPKPGKSWWWIDDDEYVLSFQELPEYQVVERNEFSRWMPLGTGTVFTLRRQGD
jgi:hypothetical protein